MSLNRRSNLIKLARYFQKGDLQAAFDMYDWCGEDSDYATCGSVGCAVGHGPYAGIRKHMGDSWRAYAYNFVDIYSDDFDFLFGHTWSQYDNTPTGVVRRISYYLQHGVPQEFYYLNSNAYTEAKNLYDDVKYDSIPSDVE